MNDSELLEQYARSGSEAAFTELVERHLNLVFSAALRQVSGDRHLAKDVAQSVFCDLARKAGKLTDHKVLSGWLYTSTRFAAARQVRGEQRRIAREQEVYKMQDGSTPPEEPVNPQELQAVLDDAMHQLKETDREAILLRFFEGRQFAEVGATIGVSADGARMRVERALEKLRLLLAKHGIAASSAALAAILVQQSVTAAPAGLVATIASGALASAALTGGAIAGSVAATAAGVQAGAAGTAATTEGILTTLKIMGMTKLQAGAVALILAGGTVPLVLQHQTNRELSAANRSLSHQNEELAGQLAPLTAENIRLSNLVAGSVQKADGNSSNEIYRLRAEVTRLRQEASDPARAKLAAAGGNQDTIDETLQTLGVRVASLPHMQIPELQYLSDKNWLDAVSSLKKLETDDDYREAMNMLRAQAKSEVGRKLREGIRKYADANGGMLPESLPQVQSYLERPLDSAALDRYQMVGTGKLDDLRKDQSVFEEIAPPVDNEHDTYFRFMRNGSSSTSFSQVGFMIEAAAEAYANANGGKLPREVGQLTSYLQQPVEPARVQKYLNQIPPNVSTLAEMKARQN